MEGINKPRSMVIDIELFDYVQKIIEVVFEMLARREESEADRKALEALTILKEQLTKQSKPIDGIPFMTWLSVREFAVLRSELNLGKHLHDYKDKFTIASYDQDIKQDAVIFQGTVDSVETMFRVGHWVGFMHQLYISTVGKDYKIDPDWNNRPNN